MRRGLSRRRGSYWRSPAGLVSWWQAEGDGLDAQSVNPGALVGNVAFVPGRIGNAFRLDGNGYIEVAASNTLEPSTVTVAAWVRAVAPGPGRYILSKGAFHCTAASYALYTGINGELYFYVGHSGSFTLSASAGSGVWDGQWHHVAGTFSFSDTLNDSGTVRLYVDGLEVGTGRPTGGMPIGYGALTNDRFYIGAYRGSCDLGFTGDIDEVQVYDRALAASEILSLFQSASVSFTSLSGTGAAVPGGAGVFASFPQAPALSGGAASFFGLGSAGTAGIYFGEVLVPPNPIRVADLTTTIPGGTGMFTGFTQLAASGTLTSFIGTGSGQTGVYSCDSAAPTDPCREIADLFTPIPGSTGNFTGFTQLAASGTGNFTGFTSLTTSLGHTAFLGLGIFGQAGIYLASTLSKVIAVGDNIGGKTVATLRLGRFGFEVSGTVTTTSKLLRLTGQQDATESGP